MAPRPLRASHRTLTAVSRLRCDAAVRADGCAEYSSAGTSHAFCNADSDLGIDERLPATACQLACDSCFQTCATCISSGQPVRTPQTPCHLVVLLSSDLLVSFRIFCIIANGVHGVSDNHCHLITSTGSAC